MGPTLKKTPHHAGEFSAAGEFQHHAGEFSAAGEFQHHAGEFSAAGEFGITQAGSALFQEESGRRWIFNSFEADSRYGKGQASGVQ